MEEPVLQPETPVSQTSVVDRHLASSLSGANELRDAKPGWINTHRQPLRCQVVSAPLTRPLLKRLVMEVANVDDSRLMGFATGQSEVLCCD